MADEPISLDELLERQEGASGRQLVTIEPVPDRPEHVRVTPVGDDGCRCGQALVLPRSLVRTLRPTGEEHRCCRGKRLLVVELEVTDPTVADILQQLAAQHVEGDRRLGEEPAPRRTGAGPGPAWDARDPRSARDWWGAWPEPVPSRGPFPAARYARPSADFAPGRSPYVDDPIQGPEGWPERYTDPCYRSRLACEHDCRIWGGGMNAFCLCQCDHLYRRCTGDPGPFPDC